MLDRPIVLPSVNARIELSSELGPDGRLVRDVAVPLPGLPGGLARFARGTRFGNLRMPTSSFVLGVHETPSDRVPWPLPSGIGAASLFGLEPAGQVLDPPAEVILPAPAGFAAGSRVRLWQMDPDTGVYAPLPGSSAGNATVVEREGVREVVPDEGAHLARLGTLLVVPPDAIMVRGCAAERVSGNPIVQADVSVLDALGTPLEGSLACGASKWQTIQRIVLPASVPGILTGLILAMARGAGEVAPLMMVGVVKLAPALPLDLEWPFIHLDRKFMHLGFHIYDLGFQSPDSEAAVPMVFATPFLLILLVLILNLGAIVLRDRIRRRLSTAAF